jgi:putative methionine-R-sulfoxide reductase with GAF domain
MASILQGSRPASSNRRCRVRQKVHVPAYATILGASPGEMLDLYEVLDMSEGGVALQCSSPLALNRTVELSLDLAEASAQISATARVAWLDSGGRVGLAFSPLGYAAVRRLQEWLFLNAIASAANAEFPAAQSDPVQSPAVHSEALQSEAPQTFALRQNYTDMLSAASAVQREVESLGTDLEAVLSLIASRSRSLLQASSAAIALAGSDPATLICRVSAGHSAPPVGASLQAGAGFSGECVRTAKLLRCDDTETDELVDRQSCRALGIRSMLAAPVRLNESVIGLLEVFSAQASAFRESDGDLLQRLADTILAAVQRVADQHDPPVPPSAPATPFTPSPGSILFAHFPEEDKNAQAKVENKDEAQEVSDDTSDNPDHLGGIRLPRSHLFLLIATAATIAMALGFVSAPWIQFWVQQKLHSDARMEQTVLASSRPPFDASNSAAGKLSADSANLAQLRELAKRDDAAAENALGLLYAQGDAKHAVKQDEREAALWFIKAAENGNVPAQSKLGSLYLSGRGLPQSSTQAYFWTVLARAGGDGASKVLAPFIAARLKPVQRTAVEQQAEEWLQRHELSTKAAR